MECGELWLCLSFNSSYSFANSKISDDTHFTFSIDEKDFEHFGTILKCANAIFWKGNKSEGNSCYFLDPDGHKLEAHIGGLYQRLKVCKHKPL